MYVHAMDLDSYSSIRRDVPRRTGTVIIETLPVFSTRTLSPTLYS